LNGEGSGQSEACGPDWASWLINAFGPDKEAVKEISEQPKAKHIFTAGRLVLKIAITVSGRIEAGEGIEGSAPRLTTLITAEAYALHEAKSPTRSANTTTGTTPG
jgi:hypothetical protein